MIIDLWGWIQLRMIDFLRNNKVKRAKNLVYTKPPIVNHRVYNQVQKKILNFCRHKDNKLIEILIKKVLNKAVNTNSTKKN